MVPIPSYNFKTVTLVTCTEQLITAFIGLYLKYLNVSLKLKGHQRRVKDYFDQG